MIELLSIIAETITKIINETNDRQNIDPNIDKLHKNPAKYPLKLFNSKYLEIIKGDIKIIIAIIK